MLPWSCPLMKTVIALFAMVPLTFGPRANPQRFTATDDRYRNSRTAQQQRNHRHRALAPRHNLDIHHDRPTIRHLGPERVDRSGPTASVNRENPLPTQAGMVVHQFTAPIGG